MNEVLEALERGRLFAQARLEKQHQEWIKIQENIERLRPERAAQVPRRDRNCSTCNGGGPCYNPCEGCVRCDNWW